MIKIKTYAKDKENSNNATASPNSGGYANTSMTTINGGLETHTIWGQPFNGTQDVKGDLYSVGEINASGNISTQGNISTVNGSVNGATVSATTSAYTPSLSATTASGSTLNYDSAQFKNLMADYLSATTADITTLNVDKLTARQANFFQLIIDKIKSTSGSIIVTPSNAKVDIVKRGDATSTDERPPIYLYWRAEDNGKSIANEFEIGDQVICQSFNQATVGVSYNIQNTYYWALVNDSGRTKLKTDGYDGYGYFTVMNYIKLDPWVYDGTLDPKEGDEIVLLGHRQRKDETAEDAAERQNAIIISAYKSPDTKVSSPSIAQYSGIKSFSFPTPISLISGTENHFQGSFTTVGGKNIEDLIKRNSPWNYWLTVSPMMYTKDTEVKAIGWLQRGNNDEPTENHSLEVKVYGVNGNQKTFLQSGNPAITFTATTAYTSYIIELCPPSGLGVYDSKTVQYVPIANVTDGADGTDAEFYRLVPSVELATVDINDKLNARLSYKLQHIKGDTSEFLTNWGDYMISAQTDEGQNVDLTDTNGVYEFNGTVLNGYHTMPHPPKRISVILTKGRDIVDARDVTITFDAAATLTVNDQISTRVQTVEGDVSTLKDKGDEWERQITSISGDVSTVSASTKDITLKLNQTGIDIQNGSITLNADNTNIVGALALHAKQNNGLIVYDKYGDPRVSIQPREIGRMSDNNNMSTHDYLFKMTYFDVNNDTSFNKAIPKYDLKLINANGKIQINEAYIDINYIKGDTNDWTQPPQTIRYEYRVYGYTDVDYSGLRLIYTDKGTSTLETTANSHIYSIKNLDYTVKNDMYYYVEVYVEATIPSGTTQVELSLNGYIMKNVPSLTFIGQDGYYSTQGVYKKIWFGKEGFEVIWADDKAAANGHYDGLKLDENGLQRLALFATTSDGSVVKHYAPISSFRRIKMLTKADFHDAYSYTLKRTIKAYTVKPTDETVIITDCLSSYFVILPNNVVDGRLVELKNVTDQNPSILLEKGYEGAAQPYLMDFRRGNDHLRDMGNRVWQVKACNLQNTVGSGEMRGYTQWMVWND